jgi:hypothetical protein
VLPHAQFRLRCQQWRPFHMRLLRLLLHQVRARAALQAMPEISAPMVPKCEVFVALTHEWVVNNCAATAFRQCDQLVRPVRPECLHTYVTNLRISMPQNYQQASIRRATSCRSLQMQTQSPSPLRHSTDRSLASARSSNALVPPSSTNRNLWV